MLGGTVLADKKVNGRKWIPLDEWRKSRKESDGAKDNSGGSDSFRFNPGAGGNANGNSAERVHGRDTDSRE